MNEKLFCDGCGRHFQPSDLKHKITIETQPHGRIMEGTYYVCDFCLDTLRFRKRK